MYKLSARGFVDPSGAETPFLLLRTSAGSAEWSAKQERAIDDYDAPPAGETKAFYALFDFYIAAATYGRTSLKVLDIGCGISASPPEYVTTLVGAGGNNVYVGIDPIERDIARRSYPFICGRIEDVSDALTDKFDVFLFSTTLDHFEDIGAVARAVKQLAREDAICLFWLGLHDTPAVAEMMATGFFRKLYRSLSAGRFAIGYLIALLKLLRYYWRLVSRARKLKAGKPLDELHFHYFTSDSAPKYLGLFGQVVAQFRVPGSNMLFATVSLRNPR